jgi:hypothetical protein
MANITNAEVNAACAAIPVSWFGPATRVTNVESPQLTNTNDFTVRVFYGDGDTTSVTINYDELTDSTDSKQIIFAAVIDDWAAAIDTPYGPITRTTAVADLGINALNAFDTPITFTLASPYTSETVELTYNELKYEDIVIERLKRVVGVSSVVQTIIDELSALNTVAQAMTAPHTDADYATLIEGLRDLNYLVGGFRLN